MLSITGPPLCAFPLEHATGTFAYVVSPSCPSRWCLQHPHALPVRSGVTVPCSLGADVQDTSTGQTIAQHRTKMGPCAALRHNPYNAVSLMGHAQGVVTMWTPNMSTPVIKMLAHRVSHPPLITSFDY